MKLNILTIFIVLHHLIYCSSLEKGDTLVIHPINWNTPSPVGWNAQYNVNINFPDSEGPWAKIIMLHTLKCDSATNGDSYPCGEWDYIWNTQISVPKDSALEIFSIGSFVTPYGKRLNLGGTSGWEWSYDITDYAPLLRGTKKVTVGNNQELLDLKILFIKGTPTRDVLKVENIYPYGEYKYYEISDDIKLKQKTINLLKNAQGFKIKAVISGHGHEGPNNCCEWDSKTHTYYMDNWEIFRWNVWKDCGNNPLFPQGGTWPFDRAGWCPGTKVDEYDFELTPYVKPGERILLDYGIEPYSDNGEKNGFFYMNHQLFSYSEPNFQTEVELVDIITPSEKKKYSRSNPDLTHSKIIIRNNGKFTLRTLNIHYGLKKGEKSLYKWIGNLNFLEQISIALPKPEWNGIKINQDFVVHLDKPNNTNDQNITNNRMTVRVPIPKLLPEEFIIKLETNNLNRARENSFTISDHNGYVLYSDENFLDSYDYEYIIKLKTGNYQFLFSDMKEDGVSLHWWNRNSTEKIGIDGKIVFTNLEGDTLHNFEPDFGQEIRFNFRIGPLP